MDIAIPCTIRRLNPDDAEEWAKLRREALESHPFAFGSSVPDEFRSLVETSSERLKGSEDSAYFGAFANDVIVGTIGIHRDGSAKRRHKCGIVAMFVRDRNRRSGIGELLMKAAIQHARSWDGVEQVLLVVNDVAPEAKRLYERNGFRTWGLEPRSLRLADRYTDATHMILDLREWQDT